MAAQTLPTPFPIRLLGALAIDPVIYEEVEADQTATWQALLVVVLSSLSAGIGFFGWGTASVRGVLFISALALLSWATWAVITFQIGTRLMPETQTRADVGQLLRTIGFSAAPGMLRIFGIVPGATVPAFVITAIWMLVAMVVAVRQALDYKSTARAVAVCGLGWALSIGIAVVLQLFFGPTVS
jgi:Yip1 domain